jgi:hypothetical protein
VEEHDIRTMLCGVCLVLHHKVFDIFTFFCFALLCWSLFFFTPCVDFLHWCVVWSAKANHCNLIALLFASSCFLIA